MSKDEAPNTIDPSIVKKHAVAGRLKPIRLFFHTDGGCPPGLFHAWQRANGFVYHTPQIPVISGDDFDELVGSVQSDAAHRVRHFIDPQQLFGIKPIRRFHTDAEKRLAESA